MRAVPWAALDKPRWTSRGPRLTELDTGLGRGPGEVRGAGSELTRNCWLVPRGLHRPQDVGSGDPLRRPGKGWLEAGQAPAKGLAQRLPGSAGTAVRGNSPCVWQRGGAGSVAHARMAVSGEWPLDGGWWLWRPEPVAGEQRGRLLLGGQGGRGTGDVSSGRREDRPVLEPLGCGVAPHPTTSEAGSGTGLGVSPGLRTGLRNRPLCPKNAS